MYAYLSGNLEVTLERAEKAVTNTHCCGAMNGWRLVHTERQ